MCESGMESGKVRARLRLSVFGAFSKTSDHTSFDALVGR